MQYVEAPGNIKNLAHPLVFLAGGITDCEDWQAVVREKLTGHGSPKGTLLNPRRAEFPIDNPDAAHEQIMWEHEALWMSDVITFWFAGGPSVQPIVMFEYGCHLGRYSIGGGPSKLLVGVHRNYKRRQDVLIQTEAHNRNLNGPWKVQPVQTLAKHIENIEAYLNR